MSKVIWLFGRSGAGKTTLANRLRDGLRDHGLSVLFLDGDLARGGLSSDLGYHPGARTEHHRRVAEVARLVSDQGMVPVVATMAPEYEQRDLVAKTLGSRLIWVFVDAPLDECIRRDPKGLYRKARGGGLSHFTGVTDPYEPPEHPDVVLHTDRDTVEVCVEQVLARLMPAIRR